MMVMLAKEGCRRRGVGDVVVGSDVHDVGGGGDGDGNVGDGVGRFR